MQGLERDFREMVQRALREDIGKGDITTESVIVGNPVVNAEIVAKEGGVIAGLPVAKEVFRVLDRRVKFVPVAAEGSVVKRGQRVARLSGSAKSILAGERTALNFLGRLSGIATQTAEYVKRVKGYDVRIMDTRKTTPCLRTLEKYAVSIGGGYNHRKGLWDQVLIKDNHIEVIRQLIIGCILPGNRGDSHGVGTRGLAVKRSVELARKNAPKGVKIEAEVENLSQFVAALESMPDIIMLDNIPVSEMKKAVHIRNERCRGSDSCGVIPLLEASGGVTLRNVRRIASTGVEWISIGGLTHSVRSMDLSLRIKGPAGSGKVQVSKRI
jgi:nicotinate-nucleotide pyrophosphorylase (carboxylating)